MGIFIRSDQEQLHSEGRAGTFLVFGNAGTP